MPCHRKARADRALALRDITNKQQLKSNSSNSKKFYHDSLAKLR